ncbi:MAG: AzlD domain-containing protein [Bacteroidaceae bacterium]|nr:AzlD domain-containing protein [Bacteroidaceae bacterium]
MEKHSIIIYIIATVIVTNLIRIVPVTLIRKRINNQYIRSFLYYVPYVTLAVMTFPAIIDATDSPLAGALAFAIGIIGAWYGLGLIWEALLCCVIVLLTGTLL